MPTHDPGMKVLSCNFLLGICIDSILLLQMIFICFVFHFTSHGVYDANLQNILVASLMSLLYICDKTDGCGIRAFPKMVDSHATAVQNTVTEAHLWSRRVV
jgi:hypothetical protein